MATIAGVNDNGLSADERLMGGAANAGTDVQVGLRRLGVSVGRRVRGERIERVAHPCLSDNFESSASHPVQHVHTLRCIPHAIGYTLYELENRQPNIHLNG